ncbi:hypothetical protein [Actinosynnema sp. NPDC020468]|uniref:hypothetical protein n=1 Tax=Actinosynnema sp. NPDC020468 TaxID=3154488 RepID=UPI003400DF81
MFDAPAVVPDVPGGRWAFEFGMILPNWVPELVSVFACVWCVALMPCCTLPNVVAARSACATEFWFELLTAGTANSPIGPMAFGFSSRPFNPREIEVIRSWKEPALDANPSIDELFIENPVPPVGPPTPVNGGGFDPLLVLLFGFALEFVLELELELMFLAMAGSPP